MKVAKDHQDATVFCYLQVSHQIIDPFQYGAPLQEDLAELESDDSMFDVLVETLQPVHSRQVTGIWWYLLEGLVWMTTTSEVQACFVDVHMLG